MEYVAAADVEDDCFLCRFFANDDDAASHVLFRGKTAFVILNAYPYNSGHLMVAPNRHVGRLDELSVEERAELMEVTNTSIDRIEEGLSAHGFNVGLNLGRVAGAGIPGHLHVHIVPRWGGDTNFMPVVGDTKVLPEMLAETDAKLRPLFRRA
jgi:ATP adenylyltransferase